MIDQLIIGDKGSYDDFGASLSKRNIGQPKKKSIKETVPFSNKTYDFSAINGEIYWEERELEYTFEMTANTPEKLEEMKGAFADWVMYIHEQDIHDPFIFGYHFVGTFAEVDFEDDEGLDKTTATVKFTAYPFKLSNIVKKYTYTINAGATIDVSMLNQSVHRVIPTITADKDFILKTGTASISVSAGMGMTGKIMFDTGIVKIALQNPNASACTVEFSFFEEVL